MVDAVENSIHYIQFWVRVMRKRKAASAKLSAQQETQRRLTAARTQQENKKLVAIQQLKTEQAAQFQTNLKLEAEAEAERSPGVVMRPSSRALSPEQPQHVLCAFRSVKGGASAGRSFNRGVKPKPKPKPKPKQKPEVPQTETETDTETEAETHSHTPDKKLEFNARVMGLVAVGMGRMNHMAGRDDGQGKDMTQHHVVQYQIESAKNDHNPDKVLQGERKKEEEKLIAKEKSLAASESLLVKPKFVSGEGAGISSKPRTVLTANNAGGNNHNIIVVDDNDEPHFVSGYSNNGGGYATKAAPSTPPNTNPFSPAAKKINNNNNIGSRLWSATNKSPRGNNNPSRRPVTAEESRSRAMEMQLSQQKVDLGIEGNVTLEQSYREVSLFNNGLGGLSLGFSSAGRGFGYGDSRPATVGERGHNYSDFSSRGGLSPSTSPTPRKPKNNNKMGWRGGGGGGRKGGAGGG